MKNDKKVKKQFHDLYFEGIIQLRGDDEEKLSNTVEEILKIYEKSSFGVQRIETVRGGVDLYSTNNRMSQRVGTFLYKKYGGEYKESKKLFSLNKQTSKEIFRASILYRLPEFFKDDIITLKDKVLKVVKYSKDTIKAIDLDKINKEENVSFKVTEEIKNHIGIQKNKFEVEIELKKPFVQILHPETFQMIRVINPPKNSNIGDKINVVVINDKAYVID